MEKFNKEIRSQETEYRNPPQPKNHCITQRHKEHKDFVVVFYSKHETLNLKLLLTRIAQMFFGGEVIILNFNMSFILWVF
jgi:hypothetical protein